MDIDLLSKMVKELILDNDNVVLPGLGSFVAEVVPSTFSDKGYTINPPYRRLYFRTKPDQGDMLAEFYASMNNVDVDVASRIIKDFLAELKSILYTRKIVVFPELGRLRATKENNIFFVADLDLDIYPEGMGLEPVSLRTHQEKDSDVAASVAGLKSILDENHVEQMAPADNQDEVIAEPVIELLPDPVPDAVDDPVVVSSTEVSADNGHPAEPDAVTVASAEAAVVAAEEIIAVAADVEEAPERSFWKSAGKVMLILLVVSVVLLAVFVALAHICPEIVDRLLYTQEELEILSKTNI